MRPLLFAALLAFAPAARAYAPVGTAAARSAAQTALAAGVNALDLCVFDAHGYARQAQRRPVRRMETWRLVRL